VLRLWKPIYWMQEGVRVFLFPLRKSDVRGSVRWGPARKHRIDTPAPPVGCRLVTPNNRAGFDAGFLDLH
jgi:hypothetical protein